MNINNNNYEEFFILYWDNELGAEQKKIVETFVGANKELQEEFRLFGETRFTPENNLTFTEKDLLQINENSFIDFSNYHEQLLSYIDDELNADQKDAVEKYATKHPAVQAELTLFQKTKLQPESAIVFSDKSTLYRREEKVRVINMIWMRVAVAAALILIAGLVTIRVINNNSKGETVELVSAEVPISQPNTPLIRNQEPTVDVKKKEPLITNTIVKKEVQKIPADNLIAKTTVVTDTKNKNKLPNEKLATDPSLIAQQSIEASFPENINIDNNAIAVTDKKNNSNLFETSSVTERPSPTYIIYDASDDPKENVDNGGLKGLLRKATRVFERRTKIQATTEDNKLLVGVFAVSLK